MKNAITIHADVVAYLKDKIAMTASLDPGKKVIGLWVEVTKKGCSGNAYDFDVMTEERLAEFAGRNRFDQPEKIEQDGVTVYLDPQSVMKIVGSELYLIKDQFSARLDFRNPNAKEFCGCGESFTVETPVQGHA
ncbi:MAG: iron-sulfur cluster assembly accessory protein [Alphaproteobacteria bacterium]